MATQKWNWRCLFVALVWVSDSASAQSLERFSFAEPHLGTIVELTIYASEETVANEAARTAFARVKELDLIFSDYKPESEAMRLCENAGSGHPTKVSSELFQVLKQADAVSERTAGAFDVTVGPLVKLWRRARKDKRLPTADEIATAKDLVGWKLITLDQANQTVELKRQGMRLDFGGIAKGYIAQDVSRLLEKMGLDRTLVAISGDIVAGDSPPNSAGWKVGIAPLKGGAPALSRLLQLKHRAVSTSGDAFQFVEINGIRYSHIVDPRTGLGLTWRSSVTVIAEDGTTADALDTAISVLGTEQGLKLIDENPQLAALVAQETDEGIKTFESKQFSRLLLK